MRFRDATTRYHGVIFGCAVDIVAADSGSLAPEAARLHRLDAQFSRFRPASELSRLNAAAGTWLDISVPMYRLLQHALTIAVSSRGLVNAAVLPWLIAAGYSRSWPGPLDDDDADHDIVERLGGVPPLTEVLELQSARARLRPGSAVDFGGLAKGWWADEVVARLGANAVCSIGGDLACRGPGVEGRGWPVRIPDGRVLHVLDAGVATSGTGKRRWHAGGHHLIDPRTGHPSTSDVAEVTVVAGTATEAEWTSTAIVIGGPDEARRLRVGRVVLDCYVSPVS